MVEPNEAWIVAGGWEGHEPFKVADLFAEDLAAAELTVRIMTNWDAFRDPEALRNLRLVVPVWTQGTIGREELRGLLDAVAGGVGIGGVHGGMADAFRNETEYQHMVGGQWVAHPGNDGVTYQVRITRPDHPIVAGIEDFTVVSEKYYMHVDPAIEVLAVTDFGSVAMPVVWTTRYGDGRVFYCSIGHHADVVAREPVRTLVRRGLWWAAGRDPAGADPF